MTKDNPDRRQRKTKETKLLEGKKRGLLGFLKGRF